MDGLESGGVIRTVGEVRDKMRLFCRGDKQHGNIQSTLPKEQNTCFSFYYILAFLRVYWQRV